MPFPMESYDEAVATLCTVVMERNAERQPC